MDLDYGQDLPPPPTPPQGGPGPTPPQGPAFTIVPRAQWGMQAPARRQEALGKVTMITVHHTDFMPQWKGRSDAQIMTSIDNGHHANGWPTIGYHFVIGRDGKVYQACDDTRLGIHTFRNNTGNLGIAVIGNFENALPVTAQLRALEAFLENRRTRLGLARRQVAGHRDHTKPGHTTCPGERLHAWLLAYRARA